MVSVQKKNQLLLNVIDLQTIEVRDATGMTRYAKCAGPKDRRSETDISTDSVL